jgi:hypothetical protein
MLLDTRQRDAPVVAWATPDEEVTPVDGCRLLEVEDEVDVEVELLEVAALAVEEAEVPGMVAAPTAPSTATDATAPNAAATVRRFMSASAVSRDRMRRSVESVASMAYRLRRPSEPNVGEPCEVPERGASGAG